MKALIRLFILTILLTWSHAAHADVVHFSNGDRLTGKILERGEQFIQIRVEGIGDLDIKNSLVEKAMTDHEIKLAQQLEEEKKKKEKPWSGKATVGFDRKRGNTNTTELFGEGEINWTKERTQAKAKGRAFYSAENRKMNEQKYYGLARVDRRFFDSKKPFAFIQNEVDRDRFSGIDIRFVWAGGVGYHIWERPDLKFLIETGFGMSHTRFRDDTEGTDELTVTPRAYFEKKLWGNSKISEEIRVYPELTNSGEYRLVSDTIFENAITEDVSIKFQFIDEYNSMPGEGSKKNDIRILSGVAYTF